MKTDPLGTIFPEKWNAFLSSAGDLFMPSSMITMLTLKGPNEMSLVVSAYIFLYALVHALEHILMDCLRNSTACIWDYSVTHSLHTIIPIFSPHDASLKIQPRRKKWLLNNNLYIIDGAIGW